MTVADKKQETFQLLCTDYYQLTMAAVSMHVGPKDANKKVGFEAFVRRTRKRVNPVDDYYIFGGEQNIRKMIAKVRQELRDFENGDTSLPDTFMRLLRRSFGPQVTPAYLKIQQNFTQMYIDTNFVFTVMPEGVFFKPEVPVFQYYGPLWIGYLLETMVLYEINGPTGYATRKHLYLVSRKLQNEFYDPMFKNKEVPEEYRKALLLRAEQYRDATDTILLDASFRRSPTYETALAATKIALETGWDGTGNVGLYFDIGDEAFKSLGGTQAHSFIMSRYAGPAADNTLHEQLAFRQWNDVFPGTTMLIDTYGVMKAVESIIMLRVKPSDMRIDSYPLDQHCLAVRERLDQEGWDDTLCYLSGDITPRSLKDFYRRGLPFGKVQAGTKFVNDYRLADEINAGFVYKLVHLETPYGIIYPKKTSSGKTNRPGLKRVTHVGGTVRVEKANKDTMGFHGMTCAEGQDSPEKVTFEFVTNSNSQYT